MTARPGAPAPPHRRFNIRVIFTVGAVALAMAGLGIGLARACDTEASRDEKIHNFERTITASERRIRDARTAIAQLTQTPDDR